MHALFLQRYINRVMALVVSLHLYHNYLRLNGGVTLCTVLTDLLHTKKCTRYVGVIG